MGKNIQDRLRKEKTGMVGYRSAKQQHKRNNTDAIEDNEEESDQI